MVATTAAIVVFCFVVVAFCATVVAHDNGGIWHSGSSDNNSAVEGLFFSLSVRWQLCFIGIDSEGGCL